jgi:hypothetical protein
MLFRAEERRFAAAVSRIAYDNPFSPERIESERQALGTAFTDSGQVWVPDRGHLATQQFHRERPNVIQLRDMSWQLALELRERLSGPRGDLTAAELLLYEDLCLYALFARYELSLYELAIDESGQARRAGFYPAFKRDFDRLLVEPELSLSSAKFAAPSITSSVTCSACLGRSRSCAPRPGIPCSPTTCGATGTACSDTWPTSRR